MGRMLIPALAALIPLLPLAGWVANGLWGGRLGRRAVAAVACGACGAAFAASALLFWQLRALPGEVAHVDLYQWIGVGPLQVPLRLLVDPLSVTMALVVTAVGFLIHVYSAG
ncbi:MAG TPA: NADH-quinone oxidoreductase subunit L, partial [bacterium]|nr:NADH-quinone oxidoreductase subunit L [bacterium]